MEEEEKNEGFPRPGGDFVAPVNYRKITFRKFQASKKKEIKNRTW
jgi:hypothetical protein